MSLPPSSGADTMLVNPLWQRRKQSLKRRVPTPFWHGWSFEQASLCGIAVNSSNHMCVRARDNTVHYWELVLCFEVRLLTSAQNYSDPMYQSILTNRPAPIIVVARSKAFDTAAARVQTRVWLCGILWLWGRFPLPFYIPFASPKSSSLSPEAGTIGQEWPQCQ
jgi:hypothetical protein